MYIDIYIYIIHDSFLTLYFTLIKREFEESSCKDTYYLVEPGFSYIGTLPGCVFQGYGTLDGA